MWSCTRNKRMEPGMLLLTLVEAFQMQRTDIIPPNFITIRKVGEPKVLVVIDHFT